MQKTPLSQVKKINCYDLIEDKFFIMREKCENVNCTEMIYLSRESISDLHPAISR